NLSLILSSYSLGTLTLERLFALQDGVVMLLTPDHPELTQSALVDILKRWKKNNLYVQVYRYEGAPQSEAAFKVAEEVGCRLVAVQPVYYLRQEDAYAHEVMLSIGAQTTLLEDD